MQKSSDKRSTAQHEACFAPAAGTAPFLKRGSGEVRKFRKWRKRDPLYARRGSDLH